VSDQEEKMS